MEIFLLNFAAYIQVQMHVMVRLINHVFKVVKTEVVDCCPLVDFLSLACISFNFHSIDFEKSDLRSIHLVVPVSIKKC